MVTLQYTLFCTTGEYRPISTLIQVENLAYYREHKKEVHMRCLRSIMAKRYVDASWIKENHYTQCKVRIYDKALIAKQNAERYEQIKKERGWK